jgi:hypothetical protein
LIDFDLQHDLINKLSAVGLWAQEGRDSMARGRYSKATEAFDWIKKAAQEAIELLKKGKAYGE